MLAITLRVGFKVPCMGKGFRTGLAPANLRNEEGLKDEQVFRVGEICDAGIPWRWWRNAQILSVLDRRKRVAECFRIRSEWVQLNGSALGVMAEVLVSTMKL